MNDPFDAFATRRTTACAPAVSGRRWARRAIVAVLLALAVAAGEAKLIEKASVAGANCGAGAACALVRVVDNSLSSAFTPLAVRR